MRQLDGISKEMSNITGYKVQLQNKIWIFVIPSTLLLSLISLILVGKHGFGQDGYGKGCGHHKK